jgi:hypothetical protein
MAKRTITDVLVQAARKDYAKIIEAQNAEVLELTKEFTPDAMARFEELKKKIMSWNIPNFGPSASEELALRLVFYSGGDILL